MECDFFHTKILFYSLLLHASGLFHLKWQGEVTFLLKHMNFHSEV